MAHPAQAASAAALDVDFWSFFEHSSSPWLLLHPDPPRFSVACANDAYLFATGSRRELILGQPVGDVSPFGRAAGNAAFHRLVGSLERVLDSGLPETLGVERYRLPPAENAGAGFDERCFSAQNARLASSRGPVAGLSHRLEDLTLLVRAKAPAPSRSEIEQVRAEHAESLDAAQRELDALSYAISHDLRAPLRAIDGFGEALEADHAHALDAAGRDYLGRIRAGAARSFALIDDLLELSRIQRAPFAPSSLDLSELARQIVGGLQAREPERQARVRIAPGMTAHADARLMRIALEHLLGNAWKFTGSAAATEIDFSVESSQAGYRYCISDNGIGFDMAYADRLFSPFQRLHKPTAPGGNGTGLATARRIVSRHGGRISIEGRVGSGARVYFTLGERVAAEG